VQYLQKVCASIMAETFTNHTPADHRLSKLWNLKNFCAQLGLRDHARLKLTEQRWKSAAWSKSKECCSALIFWATQKEDGQGVMKISNSNLRWWRCAGTEQQPAGSKVMYVLSCMDVDKFGSNLM
jgi:hypothetical protein